MVWTHILKPNALWTEALAASNANGEAAGLGGEAEGGRAHWGMKEKTGMKPFIKEKRLSTASAPGASRSVQHWLNLPTAQSGTKSYLKSGSVQPGTHWPHVASGRGQWPPAGCARPPGLTSS